MSCRLPVCQRPTTPGRRNDAPPRRNDAAPRAWSGTLQVPTPHPGSRPLHSPPFQPKTHHPRAHAVEVTPCRQGGSKAAMLAALNSRLVGKHFTPQRGIPNVAGGGEKRNPREPEPEASCAPEGRPRACSPKDLHPLRRSGRPYRDLIQKVGRKWATPHLIRESAEGSHPWSGNRLVSQHPRRRGRERRLHPSGEGKVRFQSAGLTKLARSARDTSHFSLGTLTNVK